MEMVKEFRGIPRKYAEAAIATLPDAEAVDGGFAGTDWSIDLEDLPPVALGSMTFMRFRFVLRGGPATVERVWEELSPSFLRGGG